MNRGDWHVVAALAALVATAIALLGWLDARRAARQLAGLERAVCESEVPAEALEPLRPLLRDPESFRNRPDRPAWMLLGGFSGSGDARVYFESAATLWCSAASWTPSPDGASSWPQDVGRWEEVAWSEGCRGAWADGRLVVARTLRVEPGRYVVVVVSRRRG